MGIWGVTVLAVCAVVAVGVDVATYQSALRSWAATEERFYASFNAGETYPAASAGRRADDRKPMQPSIGPQQAQRNSVKESVTYYDSAGKKQKVVVTDASRSTSGSGSSDSGSSIAGETPDTDRQHTAAVNKPLRQRTAAPELMFGSPTELPFQEPPPAGASRRSFSDVCSQDSSDRCSDPNPFTATFCLVSKKESLTKDCRDYLTAKVNCYLSTAKLCAGAQSHLKCLYQHRYSASLPRMCTRTRFFEYVASGVSLKDVMMDEAVPTGSQ